MNCLFSYYFESSWNSSRYKFFAWYVICQYFLLFCGLSYYSLNSVLRRSKLLILMTYYLSFFSFIDYNFSVIARDILPKSNHKTISCMFSSKVFTVLFTFYIYSYNSFFLHNVKCRSRIILLNRDVHFLHFHSLKRLYMCYWITLYFCKN